MNKERNNMTIAQGLDERYALEKELKKVLDDFESRVGLKVHYIEIERADRMDGTSSIISVNTTIEFKQV